MLTTIAVAAAFLLTMAPPVATAPTSAAPQVEMRDAKNRRVRLSDYKGRVVLLDLWASWCTVCEASFPVLDALSRELRARGLVVIAVNLDDERKDAEAFLRKHAPDMQIVFDPRARVLKAFGAAGVPTSYLIDRQGTIRHTLSGYTADFGAQLRPHVLALLAEDAP